jgi:dienelactone hydrolase
MSERPSGRQSRPGPGNGRDRRAPARAGAHARVEGRSRVGSERARTGTARRAPTPPPRRVRPAILFGGVVVVAIALLVVHRVHPPSTPTVAKRVAPVHYSVGIVRCTFVDQSRSTKNYGTGAITPGRTLVTEIRYPTISPAPGATETASAHPARRHGPFPLVIFAHGYDLTPDTYRNLLDVWVKAGFVVAAPLFPDTNQASVDALGKVFAPEADDANQPGDVAFVVNRALADATAAQSGCPILDGLVRPGGAAITGQSDGAVTVGALAYAAAYQVPGTPIRAVISLSGGTYPAPSGKPTPYASVAGGPPLLVTQSASDTCNPPENSIALYNAVAQRDKWFLDIDHANHLPPYTGSLSAQLPAFDVVATVTKTFLTDVFSGKAITHKFLTLGNLHPTIAHLTTGASPTLPTLSMVPSTCYVN